jgi:hypothetical protein
MGCGVAVTFFMRFRSAIIATWRLMDIVNLVCLCSFTAKEHGGSVGKMLSVR